MCMFSECGIDNKTPMSVAPDARPSDPPLDSQGITTKSNQYTENSNPVVYPGFPRGVATKKSGARIYYLTKLP